MNRINRETKLVIKLYSSSAQDEWKRLIKDPYHRLEFETTLNFLKKYLPPKGLVLDAGGGPGRYTIELAKLGYDVVLVDLVKENLEIAKRQIKKQE
jgi:2-polyprenyl-3-methyl-5-hydroxy-6-metoxy-1,4-benzoquinol methylase